MKRKLKIIVKRIYFTTNLDYESAIIFLINTLKSTGFINLTSKQKKSVLFNFLVCFDSFISAIDNPKKRSKTFKDSESVLSWIDNKLYSLVCNIQHVKIY